MAHSLKPKGRTPEVDPDKIEWNETKLPPSFAQWVGAVAATKAEIKKMEERVKPYQEKILKAMQGITETKVFVDGARVNYIEQTRRTIKADKLLLAGVSEEVITKCTDETKSVFCTVTPPKED